MADPVSVSKHGSKSIGEDRLRDADAAARAAKGLPPVEPPEDDSRSSGQGKEGATPKP
ncbi:MAG: hypothetical protein JWQ89_3062 [Devosia sp.]|uniref:hypothetical protein n=1 Tax=Devosia sp. TaxID=1871048 RepID=UPI002602A8E5|nr:hypothetical protein [Devosia sp.]MDB5541335.1 hypothetical protein [Devosia sp.]